MVEKIILTEITRSDLVSEILIGVKELIKESNNHSIAEKEWLTTNEVLQLLKITSVTLWNYDQKGLTKPQKVGNRKRYRKSDILAILERKESRN